SGGHPHAPRRECEHRACYSAPLHFAHRPRGAAVPANARRLFTDWLPVVLYVGVIFTLSSQPHLQPPLHFANADKLLHLLEYGGLGLFLARALRGSMTVSRPARAATLAIVIGASLAATDEWYQSFVPGRLS